MADMVEIFTKVFGVCPVITIEGSKESVGVCDYCNARVFAPGGRIEKQCFLTDFGMMCRDCYDISPIGAMEIYEKGDELSSREWYRCSYLQEEL